MTTSEDAYLDERAAELTSGDTPKLWRPEIHVDRGWLHDALTAVMPLAGTDTTLPALNAVQLTALRPGVDCALQVAATDRYRLGTYIVRSATMTTTSPLFRRCPILLPLGEVKRLARLIKPTAQERKVGARVRLGFGPDDLAVTIDGVETLLLPVVEARLPFDERWRFPRVDRLIEQACERAKPCPMVAIEPAYLADLAKVPHVRYAEPARLWQWTTGARVDDGRANLLVRIGDHYLAVIMGVRLVDGPATAVPTAVDWTAGL